MCMQQASRPSRAPDRPPRKPANVSLPEDLVAAAKELNVNMSQACEQGLRQAVSKARSHKWVEENMAAIEYWNRYVDEHGLPLAKYRQF